LKERYEICRREHAIKDLHEDTWLEVPEVMVSNYPWGNEYTPRAEFRMYYTNTDFHIRFQAYEQEIKAEYLRINDPVYKDSCVEFFVNPNPGADERYMKNFEMNPLGVMLVGLGTGRHDRIRLKPEEISRLTVRPSLDQEGVRQYRGDSWTNELVIPLDFLHHYYGEIPFRQGWEMKGNFYKCGDDTRVPHYGCWHRIGTDRPDFHRPEYFGSIILGE
jgi:hypothetical protein